MASGVATLYDQFAATRRFDQLDGLRGISILLVITAHLHEPLWAPLRGALGVTVFFAVSGFIITTLLLREEQRHGAVSLTGFYLRRMFRIFPLYYLALAAAAVATLGVGRDEGSREQFAAALPLFASFNGDLLPATITFGHSWSLGVEEKFYLVWPLLAFTAVATRRRAVLAASLVVLATALTFFPATNYFGAYTPILGGCLLAVLLQHPTTFRRVAVLAHPGVAAVAVAALVGAAVAVDPVGAHRPVFAVLLVAALPALLLNRWMVRVLSWRPLVYVGLRSYALYLFHPLVIRAVDRVAPPGGPVVVQAARFLLVVAAGLVVAEVLFRLVERPMIRLGHRVAGAASSRSV
jgi:peptidoglycan/LPS O-acetylase OafA/YrhL